MNTQIQNGSIDVEVLKNILVNLVTVPEDVVITREIDELGVLISVRVSGQDMGLVIGRNGGMAKALKTVMTAIGMAHKMRVRVQILEPDGSTKFSGTQPKSELPLSDEPNKDAVDEEDEFALN
jgi:uncharacterized protein